MNEDSIKNIIDKLTVSVNLLRNENKRLRNRNKKLNAENMIFNDVVNASPLMTYNKKDFQDEYNKLTQTN